jgi:hypothetical protein
VTHFISGGGPEGTAGATPPVDAADPKTALAYDRTHLAPDLGRRGTPRHRVRPHVPYVPTAVIDTLLPAALRFFSGRGASDVPASPADSA